MVVDAKPLVFMPAVFLLSGWVNSQSHHGMCALRIEQMRIP